MNEQYLVKLLEDIVNDRCEKEWIEFKQNNVDPTMIGKSISAISNSANIKDQKCGYLIYGVDDDHVKVVGTKFKPYKAKKGNESLLHWITKMLNQKINICIYEFIYKGKNVVIFIIPSAVDIPTSFKNEAYIRIGDVIRKLKDFPLLEKQIWNNPSHWKFEKEIALYGNDADEVLKLIDYPSYFTLTNQNLPSNKDEILAKLESEYIVEKDKNLYNITNIGALLFAININNFVNLKRKSVRVILYNGLDRVKTIKEQVGTKGYATGFNGVVDYIQSILPANEEIKSALRIEKKLYPEIAIRELVANALIHQDFYESGTGPMIEIFDDRIEISNPGKPLIETDRFIDHNPQSRNEDLAAFMRRIGICEERGSGIDKVIFNIELYQLPAPKFEVVDNFTKTILFSFKPFNKMSKEDRIRACYQHCCLKYVSNEKMTNTSLRKRFGIKDENYPMASKIINLTTKAKLVKPFNLPQRKHAQYIPIWA